MNSTLPSRASLSLSGLNRRAALSSCGAAAGLWLMNQAVAQEKNPAAAVADSASSIRITAMKTHRVHHKVYVEIETNQKITGWGEVSALVPTAAEELAKALFELLDGENPTRIEHLWQKLYRAHRDIRGGPFMCHTLAGIDMALWDITGKLWKRAGLSPAGRAVPRQDSRLSHVKGQQGAAARASTSTPAGRPISTAWCRRSSRRASGSAPTAR